MKISTYHQYGGGGINNQKMAIIGAVVNAYEKGIPFALPRISEKDQLNDNYDKYEYDVLFDASLIESVLDKYGIDQVPFSEHIDFDISYEDCFWKTFHIFESRSFLHSEDSSRLVVDVIKSFVPRATATESYQNLKKGINATDANILFCQFRIEQDWITHCKDEVYKFRLPFEELYVDYMTICMKIVNSFPDARTLFVCADEPSMPVPKDVMRAEMHRTFGIEAIFKSDFLNGTENFRPNEHSLIDLALCVEGRNFVGTTRSTFSNMVALQKFCANPDSEQAYVYNHQSFYLKQRRDNGASSSLEQAVINFENELVVTRDQIAKINGGLAPAFVRLQEGTHLTFERMEEKDGALQLFSVSLAREKGIIGNISLPTESAMFL